MIAAAYRRWNQHDFLHAFRTPEEKMGTRTSRACEIRPLDRTLDSVCRSHFLRGHRRRLAIQRQTRISLFGFRKQDSPSQSRKGFHSLTTARIITEIGASEYDALAPIQQEQLLTDLPEADKQLAAMLVKRDSFNLAASLEGCLEAGSILTGSLDWCCGRPCPPYHSYDYQWSCGL